MAMLQPFPPGSCSGLPYASSLFLPSAAEASLVPPSPCLVTPGCSHLGSFLLSRDPGSHLPDMVPADGQPCLAEALLQSVVFLTSCPEALPLTRSLLHL